MNIISLDIENIKRLSAVFIATDGAPIVQITGKNMAGKSSVLDAIAMAIGGKRLCPSEPLKRGENAGHIVVNIGDEYIVTRKFWRKKTIDCAIGHAHTEDCQIFYGELESSLSVKSPDKADYGSPQKLLDKLVSDLTFDPLGFLELSPKDQRAMVQQFVGLDFTSIDQRRQGVQARLTEANGTVKRAARDVADGEHYPAVVAVDVQALLASLAQAEALGQVAVAAERQVEAKRRSYEATVEAIRRNDATMADLERSRNDARALGAELIGALAQALSDGKILGDAARVALAAVPDTAKLRDDLARANDINNQVAANARYVAIVGAQQEAETAALLLQAEIKQIDAEKIDQLRAATFPVKGLAFADDGLTFDGLPFDQASYAQQLRVAVAMGLALNPALKVLLIKHGNALDKASLQLLGELATEAGAQVWVEKVAETADGVSVFISDGHVEAVG